jgi:hypothetical protein
LASEKALHLATSALGSSLTTDFKLGTVQDLFFVVEPSLWTEGNLYTEFRLSHGFIRIDQPFVGSFGGSMSAMFSGNQLLDVSSSITVQREKGVVVDTSNIYQRQWVRFTYAKGFQIDPDDEFMYDQTEVPDWLKDAAKLYAKIMLQSNPSLQDVAIKMDTKMMQRALSSLVQPHMRYTPAAIQPTSTSFSGDVILATEAAAAAGNYAGAVP